MLDEHIDLVFDQLCHLIMTHSDKYKVWRIWEAQTGSVYIQARRNKHCQFRDLARISDHPRLNRHKNPRINLKKNEIIL